MPDQIESPSLERPSPAILLKNSIQQLFRCRRSIGVARGIAKWLPKITQEWSDREGHCAVIFARQENSGGAATGLDPALVTRVLFSPAVRIFKGA